MKDLLLSLTTCRQTYSELKNNYPRFSDFFKNHVLSIYSQLKSHCVVLNKSPQNRCKTSAELKESIDEYNVNIMITRLPCTCCYFDICACEYSSNLFVKSHISNIY